MTKKSYTLYLDTDLVNNIQANLEDDETLSNKVEQLLHNGLQISQDFQNMTVKEIMTEALKRHNLDIRGLREEIEALKQPQKPKQLNNTGEADL